MQEVLLSAERDRLDARVWFETEYGIGEVLVHKGRFVRARLGGARGQTALLRLLAVSEGRFGIEECTVNEQKPISEDMSSLLELHRVRQNEWKQLCANAPPLNSVLRLTPSGAEVRDSSRGIQRVVLVLIDGGRTAMQILEESSFDPVETLQVINKALADDLAQIAPPANTLYPPPDAGDTSGVLPRMGTFEPVPNSRPVDVAAPGPENDSGWRSATLVGLGSKGSLLQKQAKEALGVRGANQEGPPRTERGISPAPIIDVSKRPTDALAATRPGPVMASRVRTVLQGFNVAGAPSTPPRPSGVPAGSSIGASDELSAAAPLHQDARRALRQQVIDVAPSSAPSNRWASADSSLMPSADSISVGAAREVSSQRRFVNRYEILLRIGRGGMGTVYLSRLTSNDIGFRRLYALKLLRSHLSQDAQAAQEFLEEAKLAGRLHHANIVAVCDAGFHGQQPYLVMEYVEGCSLAQLIQGVPKRLPQLVLPIIIDALSGLHAAHNLHDDAGAELKLVHCDVSPENLLVGVDGTCRLTDFGMVRQASHTTGVTTKGKPGYVAPERISGKQFDHRSDIFSMGAVLWGALTGRRLFGGETIEETVEQVCRKPLVPPSAAGATCSRSLDQVVLKALARNPEDRYQSAEEMASELGRVARDNDGIATAKEVAAWVREIAGAELTQRRLALLDASRDNPTVPPAAEEVERAVVKVQSEHDALVLAPSRAPIPLVESSVPPGPAIDSSRPEAGEIPSGPMSSSLDVAALFYDRNSALKLRFDSDPTSRQPSADSSPPGRQGIQEQAISRGTKRGSSSSARGWLIGGLFLVLIVGAGLYFAWAKHKHSPIPARPNSTHGVRGVSSS